MGDEFSLANLPRLEVKLMGTRPFSKGHVIKNGRYVHSLEPGKSSVEFTWMDNSVRLGQTSCYYIRGERQDGEMVWVSPMWVTYTGKK